MKAKHSALMMAMLAFLSIGLPPQALAAPPKAVIQCGAVLDSPGRYALHNDLAACPGRALSIVADEVRLDLRGHTISCEDVDGRADVGITAVGVSGTRITGGTITHCDVGVELFFVAGARVTGMTVTHHEVDPLVVSQPTGAGIVGFEVEDSLFQGNHASANTTGLELFFSRRNVIRGNESNDNVLFPLFPLQTFGIGIALAFADDNIMIGNTALRNTGGGIVVANEATGNVIRGNIARDNLYGVGAFARTDLGAGMAFDNLIQGNEASGNTFADLVEVLFDANLPPGQRESLDASCANDWKSNTFATSFRPHDCGDD